MLLGFQKAELDIIAADNAKNAADATFEMLDVWRKRGGKSEARYIELVIQLNKVGHKDLVAQLEGQMEGMA